MSGVDTQPRPSKKSESAQGAGAASKHSAGAKPRGGGAGGVSKRQERRPAGTGRLFTLADRQGRESWYGSWWAQGRRVKRKIGLKVSRECPEGLTRVMAERELQRRMAADQVLAPGTRVNIEQAGQAYVSHLEKRKQRKRTTVQDYRGYLRRHLVPHFKGTIDKLDADRIEAYIQLKERQELSAKTIVNHLNFLHGLMAFAIKRRWATHNPVALVDKPETPRSKHRRLRFLTVEQLELVIAAVPRDELGAVERPLYRAAASTGLRQGELIALRWCDIDWVAGRIRVAESYTRYRFDTPKSGEGRSMPMGDLLAAELERLYRRALWKRDRDLVFAHPLTGHPLDAKVLRERFYEALERAGVERITFHELRHTYGTRMAAAGAPLSSLQEWMGHADAQTTQIYRHYQQDAIGERALVERAFGPPSPPPSAHASAPRAAQPALRGDPGLQIGA